MLFNNDHRASAQNSESDKIHIIHIINDLPYWLRHREPIAAAAVKAGYQVTIASFDSQNSHAILSRGYSFYPLPSKRFGLNLSDFMLIIAIRRLIVSLKPNIVHLFTIKPILFGGLAIRFISKDNRPYVLGTIAGLGRGFYLPVMLKQLLILGLRSGLSKVVSCLTFENPVDVDIYVKSKIIRFDQAKLFRGAGVDLDLYQPNPVKKTGNSITFLFASRFIRAKGAVVFAEAASQLKTLYGGRVHFLVAGIEATDDPDGNSAEELEMIKNNPAIEWLGEVSPADMPAIMQHCEVFVLPTSYPEGLPRSCLEAGACGLAVIAGDVPGTRVLIDHNIDGLLLPDMKLDTLVDAMKKVVEADEYKKFGSALRQKIEQGGFGLNAINDEFLRIYININNSFDCEQIKLQ